MLVLVTPSLLSECSILGKLTLIVNLNPLLQPILPLLDSMAQQLLQILDVCVFAADELPLTMSLVFQLVLGCDCSDFHCLWCHVHTRCNIHQHRNLHPASLLHCNTSKHLQTADVYNLAGLLLQRKKNTRSSYKKKRPPPKCYIPPKLLPPRRLLNIHLVVFIVKGLSDLSPVQIAPQATTPPPQSELMCVWKCV